MQTSQKTTAHLRKRSLSWSVCRASLILTFSLTTRVLPAAEFIPLGILPGYGGSIAGGVTDDGFVVAGSPLSIDVGGLAASFLWTEGTGQVLLEDVPEGYRNSTSGPGDAISGDGSTVFGNLNALLPGDGIQTEAFVYSADHGWQPLGFLPTDPGRSNHSEAYASSLDGHVVVGFSTSFRPSHGGGFGWEAFRWTESGGLVGLGRLPGYEQSRATDVSADGNVIAGWSDFHDFEPPPGAFDQPFVWTSGEGMVGLGIEGRARAISSDGNTIGGDAIITSASDFEAFRWTGHSGVIGLGWLPGTEQSDGSQHSQVTSMNGDGSVIVGFSGNGRSSSRERTRPFIWTEEAGMQDLEELLINDYGLDSELSGWNLFKAHDISANGLFITGSGFNPSGKREAWQVRLGDPIPEPSTLFLIAVGSTFLTTWRNRLL